ncbi:MAG: hypothetical protein D6722_08120 [Bacteroidetes bacterium]|nr:MAG: hypothetical protein D6722_08120 [Bacteroidota bacterium]
MRMAYSLWLLPAKDDAVWMAALQHRLRSFLGGPGFAPHLTLWGQVPALSPATLDTLARISRHILPLALPLSGKGQGDLFFRAVVLEVDPIPPLLALRESVAQELRVEDPRPYAPHFSLAYGHYTTAQRLQALDQIGPLPETCTVDRLSILRTGEAGKILLPDAWEEIRTWPLGPPPRD